MSVLERVVVVGASAAGLAAVETLRRDGYAGRLVLIGKESRLPYDRPPLSKQVLAGTWSPERTSLRPEGHYGELDVDVRLGLTATGLDVASHSVTLDNGENVGYDGLIIATGVEPRRLTDGHDLKGWHVLRTMGDALALREDLHPGARLVVVGAGFLGCEIAAVARAQGLEVTLIDPFEVPMMRAIGARVGSVVAQLHRDHGTEVRMGTGITKLIGWDHRVTGVELTDGSVVAADIVVVAVGSIPLCGWLSDSGLRIDNGIVCDEMCRAAPGIYAAGDVARWHNPRFGVSMRIEHRTNATEQGMAAARNLLGAQLPFDPVPFFWTDQYDAKIQAYGIFPPDAAPIVTRGELEQRKFTVSYVSRGRITGVLGWNMPRELRSDRALVGTSAGDVAAATSDGKLG
ncbi:NAD(P)/FAD-dependent oxidoreductase [Rhodococcus sp. NPDC059968]|uniref:NAD(P)/FAD-dependent oxidoreductase n=1 Tax=Rhodococcus sp. NPDC059968 TaxID=3347017 RepID=UPI00366C9325